MKKKLLFYLLLLITITANSQQLSKYRYWFGNDLSTSQTVMSSDTALDFLLNVSNINYGLQQVNFQFQDANSRWSSVISQFFYRTKITNAQLQKFRYWFNENFAAAKTLLIGSSANNDFVTLIDVDGLSNGRYQLNYQFSDDGNLWSSVISDSITKTPITSRNNLYPVIALSKIKVNTNGTMQITGNRFTLNGQVSLTITTQNENEIIVDTTLIADTLGNVRYNFKATSNFFTGDYFVKAININTNETTDSRRFSVNGQVRQEKLLIVDGPRNTKNYAVNKPFDIQWQEKNDDKNNIGFNGLSSTNYKVEAQINGGTWTEVSTFFKTGLFNQKNPYNYRYIPNAVGTYKFRVTNLYLPTRTDTSRTINVVTNTAGVDVNFVWDYSGNRPQNVEIKGVAADGTARILMNILKQTGNNKSISKVDVQLSDGYSVSNTKLGKLAKANVTTSYSSEANTATPISLSLTSIPPNNIWIWYVAPDDFFRSNADKYSPYRTVNAEFIITYTDLSQEIVTKPIQIIRPPIMFVHGYAGSSDAWKHLIFHTPNGIQEFQNLGVLKNYIGPTTVKYVSMMPSASYINNARRLLGLKQDNTFGSTTNPNSFQSLIEETRLKGYSSNRVDYIAHSMGGAMGRSAINVFPGAYNATIPGNYTFKNYEKGFINKYITLQTPHNGSPLADMAKSWSNTFIFQTAISLWEAEGEIPDLIRSTWYYDMGANKYVITPALADMIYKNGGVRFNKTNIKNHLIGTQNSYIGSDCKTVYSDLKKEASFKPLLNIFEKAGLLTCEMVNDYLSKYGVTNFIQESDAVVPIQSQLPGKNLNALDNSYTRFPGIEFWHMKSRNPVQMGDKIFDLLNTDISSNYFADTIAKNNQAGGFAQRVSSIDTVVERIDTTHIKIVAPSIYAHFKYDSTIIVKTVIKDTSNLTETRVSFQGSTYVSYSKVPNQSYTVQVNPISKGNQYLVASAVYDSSGSTIIYTDSISLNVLPQDALSDFKIEPEAIVLNPTQTYYPVILTYHDKQVGYLHYSDTSVTKFIGDTNVVQFDSRGLLIAKDTGTTIVTYSYKGFKDTLVIIIDAKNLNASASGMTWIGVSSIDWNDNNNWSAGILPTENDDVIIPTGTPFLPTLPAGVTTSVKSLSVLQGAILTIGANAKLNIMH